MVLRGRANKVCLPNRGEGNKSAKLVASEVREMREMADAGFTNAMLAELYGVVRRQAWAIVARRLWTHID